jgi:hypothetical protein
LPQDASSTYHVAMRIALIVLLLVQGILIAIAVGGDALGIAVAGVYILLGAAVAMRPTSSVYIACIIIEVISALLLAAGGFIAFIGTESASPGTFKFGDFIPFFLLQLGTIVISALLLAAAKASSSTSAEPT